MYVVVCMFDPLGVFVSEYEDSLRLKYCLFSVFAVVLLCVYVVFFFVLYTGSILKCSGFAVGFMFCLYVVLYCVIRLNRFLYWFCIYDSA